MQTHVNDVDVVQTHVSGSVVQTYVSSVDVLQTHVSGVAVLQTYVKHMSAV